MQDSRSRGKIEESKCAQIIKIEEESLHRHLDKIVRGVVVK